MKRHDAPFRDRFNPERLAQFWRFVYERQSIWWKRELGAAPPWTTDPVLASNRFTNVYRELDPGTKYCVTAILEQDESPENRVFNTMLYRLIGRKETHSYLGFQALESFDAERLASALRDFSRKNGPVFTAAYMVSGYTSMGSREKITNVSRLFAKLHSGFENFFQSLQEAGSPQQAHATISGVVGFGNFLSYQVLVDLCYPLARNNGKQGILRFTNDEWASAGPGARKGIGYLFENRARQPPLTAMRWLRDYQRQEFDSLGLNFQYPVADDGRLIPLSLANVQNCLCEFHKYVKVSEGTGRARRRYKPEALSAPLLDIGGLT